MYDEPTLIGHILQVWRDDGLPPNVPIFISELNIAWNTGESFVDIFGGLWLADFAGSFLSAGGDALYYFHYLPVGLYHGCNGSMGTFALFTVDSNYQIQQPTSQFFASQLINLEWAQPGTGEHQIFPAESDISDPAGHVLVTAYPLLRPDGQWSVMLVNKDQENSHAIRIVFHDDKADTDSFFTGPVSLITFGSEQYEWHPEANGGKADPDGPAARSTVTAVPDTEFIAAQGLRNRATRQDCCEEQVGGKDSRLVLQPGRRPGASNPSQRARKVLRPRRGRREHETDKPPAAISQIFFRNLTRLR